jgi:hypothetical protein
MKIIITERQQKLLIENNFEKNKRLISNMWDEGNSIDDISELIGLGKTDIVLHLKDKNMKIDCELAEELTSLLFWKTNLINKNYSFNDGKRTLDFTWGGFSGIIYFTYNDETYEIIGMASPYWNGVCHIPVDLQSIEIKLTGESEEDVDIEDVSELENTPSEFNSIQEMIDFFNTVYPIEVIKVIPELISKYR